MKIAVVLPSRGLIFSQTADELLQNLEGYDYEIFFAHGLPIPDCFEKPLERALGDDRFFTHFWFVEDDMALPNDILDSLVLANTAVAACDYPVSNEGQGAVFKNAEGDVIFTGTGCLLVKREVFEQLKPPFFRTDIRWNATNYGKFIRLTANTITNPTLEGYGLHDTHFGIRLYKAGIKTEIVGQVGQRKLIALGKAGSNDGAHQIEEWHKVKPDVLLKKFQDAPAQPIGNLTTVQTVSGELTVHPDKAKKLIKAGAATAIPYKSVVFDTNGIKI